MPNIKLSSTPGTGPTLIEPGQAFWVTFATGKGREQRGQRPAVIVTDERLTALGMCWVVPTSTTARNWPTHVRLELDGQVTFAMCEQLRSVSVERVGRLIGRIERRDLSQIRQVIGDIVGH